MSDRYNVLKLDAFSLTHALTKGEHDAIVAAIGHPVTQDPRCWYDTESTDHSDWWKE